MKKLLSLSAASLLTAALAFSLIACGTKTPDDTIVVGASSTPHAEVLEAAREQVESAGYQLNVVVYTDYVTPNTALEQGNLDANYFQHTPYLENFNKQNGTHLVAAEKIHYEPFGVFGKNVTAASFAEVKTGRTILVPSDGTNCTRALLVLSDNGYITLREGVKPTDALSDLDILSKNGNTVTLVEAEQLTAQLKNADDGTLAVINGNYALEGGLNIADALAVENAEGDAAQFYANVIAVKEGNENSEKTKVLLAALKTQKIYRFIVDTYGGAVLPTFAV